MALATGIDLATMDEVVQRLSGPDRLRVVGMLDRAMVSGATPDGVVNAQPLRQRLPDEYLRFEALRPGLTAAAMSRLRRSKLRREDDQASAAALEDTLEVLAAHLGAAVLMDDDRLFLDYLGRRQATGAGPRIDNGRLGLAIEALSHALPGKRGRLGRLLDEGSRMVSVREITTEEASPATTATATGTDAAVGPALFSVGSVTGGDVVHGQVFADLLFLAAMACHAPMAVISVAQPGGNWSTLSYGVDRRKAFDDPDLFGAVAAGAAPLEILNLANDDRFGAGALATGPLAVKLVYGVPLSIPGEETSGAVFILDRRARKLNGRERQAALAVARQVSSQLALWRKSIDSRVGGAEERLVERRQGHRGGPEAVLVDLVGLRRAGFGVEPHLLRSHEVAVLFDVTERTVINWASSAKLASLRTAGGHLRFRSEDVLSLMDDQTRAAAR